MSMTSMKSAMRNCLDNRAVPQAGTAGTRRVVLATVEELV
jgi:hypothetical protein